MSLFFRHLLERVRRGLGRGPRAKRPARPGRRPGLDPLDDRAVPATLAVDVNGVLTYAAGAGVANNLTVSLSNGNYSFTDTAETITVSSIAAGGVTFTGSGTNTVTLTASPITRLEISLGDQADT